MLQVNKSHSKTSNMLLQQNVALYVTQCAINEHVYLIICSPFRYRENDSNLQKNVLIRYTCSEWTKIWMQYRIHSEYELSSNSLIC